MIANTATTTKRQQIAGLILKNAQGLHKTLPRKSGLAKSDIRYWRSRITQPTFRDRAGKLVRSPNYSVCISSGGIRKNLSLGTGEKEAAAQAALKLWSDVRSVGWDKALANLRPLPVVPSETVADFLSAIHTIVRRSPTTEGYVRNFRLLAAEVMGIKRKTKLGRELEKWKARVGAVRLADLTPARIEQWKRKRLESAAADTFSQQSAKVSVNTIIRSSKALWSRANLKQLQNELGIVFPNPLSEIGFEDAKPKKYVSRFDVRDLFAAAEKELEIEELKVFLLAVACGLRRSEIDHAVWPWFIWGRNVISLQQTKWFSGKTAGSLGEVPVDGELMKRFYGYYEQHVEKMAARREEKRNDFVIQSYRAKPRIEKSFVRYRCEDTFAKLTAWLRNHGVVGARPLHTLRKEAGSLVNATQGIHSASAFLRHANIAITAQVYADSRAMQPIRLSDLAA